MVTMVRAKQTGNKTGRRHIKRSINAETVARKVMEKVAKGENVVLSRIIKDTGYSDSVAKRPLHVTSTYSYQATLNPFISQLIMLRDKTAQALNNKDLNEAKIYDLTTLLKNVNHDLQLLHGKATENVATKSSVIVYGSDDFLAHQMERKNMAQQSQ